MHAVIVLLAWIAIAVLLFTGLIVFAGIPAPTL